MNHGYLDSPLGPLLVVGDDTGLAALYTPDHVRLPTPPGDRDDDAFPEVGEQLAEYFDGRRTTFDLVLNPIGTEFQRRVWDELRRIGYGRTASYGEIAERLGRPSAARAVGAANGRNPISIIVPCHRVIGSTGALTGYAGGLAAKEFLLAFERRTLASSAVA